MERVPWPASGQVDEWGSILGFPLRKCHPPGVHAPPSVNGNHSSRLHPALFLIMGIAVGAAKHTAGPCPQCLQLSSTWSTLGPRLCFCECLFIKPMIPELFQSARCYSK